MALSLGDVPQVAGLLGDRHRIIANDWQAAEMSVLTGRILHRAVDLLERVDFTPAALRRDLESARVAPRLLHSVSELIAHAADLLSDSAGLVHDNEPRWRRFRAQVDEVVHGASTGCGIPSVPVIGIVLLHSSPVVQRVASLSVIASGEGPWTPVRCYLR